MEFKDRIRNKLQVWSWTLVRTNKVLPAQNEKSN